jgi:hypothetical protein
MRSIILHKFKIIFFWTPKCGCSYLQSYILSLYGINWYDVENNVHDYLEKHEVEDLEMQVTADKKYNDYTKILVYRNPYHKLANFYVQRICCIKTVNHKNVNFTKFIDTFDEWKNIDQNHAQLQFSKDYEVFKQMKWTWDHIIDLYNLDAYLKNLEEKYDFVPLIEYKKKMGHEVRTNKDLKIENAYVLPANVINIMNDNNSIPPYKCFYNDELKKKTEELYNYDFHEFKKLNISFNL